MWLASVYRELKYLSGRTLSQVSFLARVAASNGCRKRYEANETALGQHSIPQKVAEMQGILLLPFL